ncbi:hypothetical protein ACOSQ2_033278 [Xanthoceras sorbifolium]
MLAVLVHHQSMSTADTSYISRGSANTDVVLAGTVKHPEDVSYDEDLTTSSTDITCTKNGYRKIINLGQKKLKV